MNLIRKDNWLPSLIDDMFNNDWLSGTERIQRIGKSIPAVNVKETDGNYVVEVAAPGMKKEDFEIELDKNLLSISAEVQEENETEDKKEKFTRREFGYSAFKRSFTLPDTVDTAKIGANYENGVLKIELPKREEAQVKPKRTIEIS